MKQFKDKFQFDWRSFRDHAATTFSSSLNDPALADVTLVADGSVSLFAHKFVLSSASPVLKQFFASNSSIYNPCLFMFGLSTDVLNAILEFIYRGETVVPYKDLDAFVMAANNLQLSLDKIPEQATNNRTNLTKGTNLAPSKMQNVNNIHSQKETVFIGNIRASKDKKTTYDDSKAETFQENEGQGTKWQGSNIKNIEASQVPEQISNNRTSLTKGKNLAPTKMQIVDNIQSKKETVLIGNIRASKDKKTIYDDSKAETFQENERQGRQGSNIKKIEASQTPALSENTRDVKIKRVVQEQRLNESFKCEHCSKTFEFKTTLRNHTLVKHSYMAVVKPDN